MKEGGKKIIHEGGTKTKGEEWRGRRKRENVVIIVRKKQIRINCKTKNKNCALSEVQKSIQTHQAVRSLRTME